jgi:hypothetical protein
MKTNYHVVPTRFGPETRFEVKPAPPAPYRVTQETELERLKKRLLARFLCERPDPRFNRYRSEEHTSELQSHAR